jgi:hypothetical protein
VTLRLLAVTIGLCLALAACAEGSDDTEEPGASPPSAGASPPSAGASPPSAGASPVDPDTGTGGGPDGSTVPRPEGTPVDPDVYTDRVAGHAFATPTGNIVCFIDAQAATWGCLIAQHTYAEPAGAESCPAAFGHGFSSVQGGTPEPLCRGDVLAAAEDGSGAILPYDQTLTVGSVTCQSATTGVTCVDQRSGHGLFLSRARYAVT